jgi:hypothetical protein
MSKSILVPVRHSRKMGGWIIVFSLYQTFASGIISGIGVLRDMMVPVRY